MAARRPATGPAGWARDRAARPCRPATYGKRSEDGGIPPVFQCLQMSQ